MCCVRLQCCARDPPGSAPAPGPGLLTTCHCALRPHKHVKVVTQPVAALHFSVAVIAACEKFFILHCFPCPCPCPLFSVSDPFLDSLWGCCWLTLHFFDVFHFHFTFYSVIYLIAPVRPSFLSFTLLPHFPLLYSTLLCYPYFLFFFFLHQVIIITSNQSINQLINHGFLRCFRFPKNWCF